MTSGNWDTQMDEIDHDHGQRGPDSGGQSGDTQGLSRAADEIEESVEELADAGQDYEAEIVQGMQDAADHPERPVYTRENQSRPPDIAPDRGSDG